MSENDGVLYIAEIMYETGELRYRYSRKKSSEGTRWIREGSFVEYYQNGNMCSEGYFIDGLEDGYWKDYHENGILAAEGYYSKGKETGTWRFFDDQANLETEEKYD